MKIKHSLLSFFLGTVAFMLVPATQVQATEIMLSKLDSEIKVGTQFSIDVDINSESNTLGTDLVLKFDPQVLSLVEVVPGSVYPEFSDTKTSLSEWNKEGIIRLSGISDFTTGVVPNGTMAILKFDSLDVGLTNIEVLYNPSDSTLTGVIPFDDSNVNLLDKVPSVLSIEIVSKNWWQQVMEFIKGIFSAK